MATRTRRSIEDRIAETQAKLKALEEKKKAMEEKRKSAKTMKLVLTKDSPGITELLNHIDSTAKQNGVKVADIIKAVAKLKRTGLVIEHRSTRFDDVMGL